MKSLAVNERRPQESGLSSDVEHYSTLVPFKIEAPSIEASFEPFHARLDRKLAVFGDMTPESLAGTSTDIKKKARAELGRLRADFEEARKAVKREYERPLRAFESECKRVTARIDEPRMMLDASIKADEQRERAQRCKGLREHYEGYAGLMAELVPFDRVIAQHADWLNKTGFEGRFRKVEQEADRIAADLEMLKRAKLFDVVGAELEYNATLDLAHVIRKDDEKREQAKRKKAVEDALQECKPQRWRKHYITVAGEMHDGDADRLQDLVIQFADAHELLLVVDVRRAEQ